MFFGSRLLLLLAIVPAIFAPSPSLAMEPDSRAAWGASAIAVADFYRRTPCEWWKVDEAAVKQVIAWSGRSLEQLRASEDYKEQFQAMEQSENYIRERYRDNSMACDAAGSIFDAEEKEYGVMRSK
ncbi:hypothetical protein CO670_27690 [Rhizobium sp. J15]|nr:hypothetical protein CO670_27690 [Rhizobium sp. J15]